jgi:nucleoside-diphosphate-sugar epimerase
MKRVFVTGASGYIGGSVAQHLARKGFEVTGLVRRAADATALGALGIRPVTGTLDDGELLARLAREADIVVNAADSDHRGALSALLGAVRGTGKTLVHTSGSSIVADEGTGGASDKVHDERTPFEPVPGKKARVAIDRLVQDAARDGVRSVVVCPTMIYGRGLGPKRDSIQVPILIRESKRLGAGVHIGAGLNIWSNVHIDDLVELYALAIEQAEPGSFFFAENGEARLGDIALAISHMLGFGGRTVAWDVDEAIGALGEEAARYALASNSRVRGVRARQELGWAPRYDTLLEEIRSGVYREDFGRVG